jgi:hypothetical protein
MESPPPYIYINKGMRMIVSDLLCIMGYFCGVISNQHSKYEYGIGDDGNQ